jgi:hypothetical protein
VRLLASAPRWTPPPALTTVTSPCRAHRASPRHGRNHLPARMARQQLGSDGPCYAPRVVPPRRVWDRSEARRRREYVANMAPFAICSSWFWWFMLTQVMGLTTLSSMSL